MIGNITDGVRVLLLEAGLPDCFWVYAAPTFCHMENITIQDDGVSKWSLANNGNEWTADTFPLGCLVYDIPAPTVEDRPKHSSRMKAGIFFGYELLAGFIWGKIY